MPKPIVSIVGRPNVGKSTLVNRLSETGRAIVDPARGVTRDRSYHEADWNGREFVLVDTGGIEGLKTDDRFSGAIRSQAEAALAESDAVLFIVDARSGPTAEDEEVARLLRRSEVPVILVANKVDDPGSADGLWDFLSLGVGEPRPVSAAHGTATGDLLDELVELLPEEAAHGQDPYPPGTVDVAVIGRPNVGKSSLVNRLSGEERSIVSDVAGTTRDAIDVVVWHGETPFRLVDTAGMRKRPNVTEDVEYYSMVRGLRAMEAAELCLLVVDAQDGITEQDQKLASMAVERGSALVVLLNKWDLVHDADERERVRLSIERRLAFCAWAPVVAISALTGRGMDKLWAAAERSVEHHEAHLPTPRVNDVLAKVRESGHTVGEGRRRLRILYGVQTAVSPPQLTLFCNHPDLVTDNYRRYLERRFREAFDLTGTPLRIGFKRR